MEFLIEISEKEIQLSNKGFKEYEKENIKIISLNFFAEEINKIIEIYKSGNLKQYIAELEKKYFFLVIINLNNNSIEVYNDFFASNEIFYIKNSEKVIISNSINFIRHNTNLDINIDLDKLYELLIFGSVCPPDSIFKNILCVPGCSCLHVNNRLILDLDNYFDITDLFVNKKYNYNFLVDNIREKIFNSLESDIDNQTGIALSGGVDSGGLLGLMTKIKDKSVASFTLGPYGKDSYDLKSSRKIVEFNKSENIEIYPKFDDLKKLVKFSENLNQPFFPHNLFFNSLILEKAKENKIEKIVYGYGTNLVLGTQLINRAAYYLEKIEKIVPFAILKKIYNFYYKNKNQKRFFSEKSWAKRWLYVKSPLLIHEKFLFKNLKEDFFNNYKKRYQNIFDNLKVNIVDRIVVAELSAWPMQSQVSHVFQVCRKYKITPVLPFEEIKVLKSIFKIPNQIRKKNKWKKQLIRDVFRPYISDELYINKPKSVIIPYTRWFKDNQKNIFSYLKKSKILDKVIDLNLFEKNYFKMKDPGYTLMKFLGLAVWYDANWDKNNLIFFEEIFKNKKGSSKIT